MVVLLDSTRVSARRQKRSCLKALGLLVTVFVAFLGYDLFHLFRASEVIAPGLSPKHFHNLVHFQAHSFNDLRQWVSLYRKGARAFKIDPHYIAPNQTSINHTMLHPARLVLTHNVPLADVDYDSLEELVQALSPDGPLMQLVKADGTHLRVQLCFKSAPEPCSAEGGQFALLLVLLVYIYIYIYI